LASLLFTGIEDVAQAIVQKIEAKHNEEKHKARPKRPPRHLTEKFLVCIQHRPARRRWRPLAQPQKAEARRADDYKTYANPARTARAVAAASDQDL
jgi:hypothetical protein